MRKILAFTLACAFALLPSAAFAQANGKSYVIKEGASLWTLKGSAMTWVASLGLGQELTSVSKNTTKGSYKGNDFDLLKVKTDTGDDGYVIESQVARDVRSLAAVTGSIATLFSQPNDRGITDTIVQRASVVAVSDVPGSSEYFKVSGYDVARGSYVTNKFILVSDVSVLDRDVGVALLLSSLKDHKKKALKEKTLQIINQKYPGSAFSQIIGEIKSAFEPGTIQTEAFATALTATDTVNVRDVPSVYGVALVAVKKGEKVTAVEKTIAEFTIGSDTGRWVKISAPQEGWVFDAWFVKGE